MPQDRFFPVTDLKFDQVVALGHGHVRYESGVTKYYAPGVQIVYSWQNPEILSTPKDFYYGYQGFYDSAVSPIAGLSGAGFVFGSTSNNLTGSGAKRVSQQVDLNGQEGTTNGDYFVTTAGTLMKVGVTVRSRSSGHSSLSTADSSLPLLRASAATIYSMFFMTTGLRAFNSGVTVAAVASASLFPVTAGYFAAAPSTLTFSAAQNVSNALVVTVPFRSAASSSNAPGLLLSWSQPTGPDQTVTNVYRVSVLSGGVDVASTFLSTSNIVTVGAGGFVGSIAAASIPTSGSYTVRVEEKIPATYASVPSGYTLDTYAVCCQGVSTVSASSTMTLTGLDTAVVTGGGAVTGGGEASVSNVTLTTAVNELSTDWAIQDLQVNLRSRVVSSSLGSLRLKPNDNAILGVVFHTGTYVVDPGATAVQLAVRDSANSGAYRLYNTNTTIVSVGDANYYRMVVLANDEDLLTAQAANLLAGSNASQTLLGELQWVTTMGTFSSDSFAVNAANEIVREPDV
jgi:hypothetical protein